MATIAHLPRPDMAKAGRAIVGLLEERKANGPPEPALDAFISELDTIVTALEQGVGGQVLTVGALKALLAQVEEADIGVDTGLRHHFHFIEVEANRRAGPNVLGSQALLAAAFPDGLEHVDDYIPDENRLCRDTIAILESKEHAPTVAAINLPVEWTKQWKADLDASESSFTELQKTRAGKSIHVLVGLDAEVGFVDVMTRLRRYIDSRASRTDKVKVAQGRLLIEPILDLLAKAKADERARATRKEHEKKAAPPAPAPAPAGSTTPATPGSGSPG